MKSSFENTVGLTIRPGITLGNRYRVVRQLGAGGFGVVFLALDMTTHRYVALKTFRDEFIADPEQRRAFEREALVWVMLGRHRSIVEAKGVEYLQGRLFIVMEFVRSDSRGRVTLSDYLKHPGRRLAQKQVVKWAIQFCLGMEYANSHGLQSHRDIKPANILITPGGDLKISDLGRARPGHTFSLSFGWPSGGELEPMARPRVAHLWSPRSEGIGGTLGYIPPEVLRGQAEDVRSDIYSFGLVLYQMATGESLPPFLPKGDLSVSVFVRKSLVNMVCQGVPKLGGPLGPIIEKCLKPEPTDRFGSFAELREALLPIRSTVPQASPVKTRVIGPEELLARGASLLVLDCLDAAAECFREATRRAPTHAPAWVGRGEAALRIGQIDEARSCINRALRLNPRCGGAWRTKGLLLEKLACRRVALRCYQKAVALDPDDTRGWLAIGGLLPRLGLVDEGRKCLEETLARDLKNAAAWECRGLFQAARGQLTEAIASYEFALVIDPQSETALVNKGIALDALNRHQDAIVCYTQALKIHPHSAAAWSNRATSLAVLGYTSLAIASCDRALARQETLGHAWQTKGNCLMQCGRYDDAWDCLLRATKLDPDEPNAWLSRGDVEASLGLVEEAENSWLRSLETDGCRDRKLGEQIQQRLGRLRDAKSNGITLIPSWLPTNRLVWQPVEPKMRPPLPRARVTTADRIRVRRKSSHVSADCGARRSRCRSGARTSVRLTSRMGKVRFNSTQASGAERR